MYGINNELAKRMERRLREKIYREMIEEQQEYRKKMEDNKIGNRNYNVKTEPDDNHTIYSSNRRNRDNSQKLLQHSTFLPVIQQRNSQQIKLQEGYGHNKAYQRYLQQRSGHSQHIQKLNQSPREFDIENGSDDTVQMGFKNQDNDQYEEKTKLYLQQCEQIIGNLKQLTNKGSRRVKPKSSKYDQSQSFFRRRPEIVKTQNNQQRQFPGRTKSFTPNYKYSFQESSSRREKTQSYSINTIRNSINDANLKQSNLNLEPDVQSNEFNQLPSSQRIHQKNPIHEISKVGKLQRGQKAKQNHRTIEPINRDRVEGLEEQKEEVSFRKSRDKTESRKEIINKTTKQNKEYKTRLAQPLAKAKVADKKAKVAQENGQSHDLEEDPEKMRKKQNAIVKYLKKARACGSLLYQKVQWHKKPGQQENMVRQKGGSGQ